MVTRNATALAAALTLTGCATTGQTVPARVVDLTGRVVAALLAAYQAACPPARDATPECAWLSARVGDVLQARGELAVETAATSGGEAKP
jgi:hypothetical protein